MFSLRWTFLNRNVVAHNWCFALNVSETFFQKKNPHEGTDYIINSKHILNVEKKISNLLPGQISAISTTPATLKSIESNNFMLLFSEYVNAVKERLSNTSCSIWNHKIRPSYFVWG